MIRERLVRLVTTTLAIAALCSPRPSGATPVVLADSSVVDHWTLANGLRVVTRHIPRARDVSITVGYRIGMDDDDAEHPGLAELAGDLGFTAATAEQPARTSTDLDRDLPQGWSDPVMRHLTLFTEAVARERALATLGHVASRMRGVRLDPAGLEDAIKRTKRELAQQYFGPPRYALGFEVREVATGVSDAQMLKRGSGAGLDGLTPADVKAVMDRWYVPANATLSIAGDLRGINTHAEIERLFGSIPGGVARADAPGRPLTRDERVLRRRGEPAAVIGVISPPLSDSTHASFYMGALLFGGLGNQTWYANPGAGGKPSAAHEAIIDYSLFDEPELLRVYPEIKPGETGFGAIDKRMSDLATLMLAADIPSDSYDEMRASVTWLIGGPMTEDERATVRGNRLAMMTLSRSQACCELRRGPAFWSGYLRRMMAVRPGQPESWGKWFIDPQHQVRVISLPNVR